MLLAVFIKIIKSKDKIGEKNGDLRENESL